MNDTSITETCGDYELKDSTPRQSRFPNSLWIFENSFGVRLPRPAEKRQDLDKHRYPPLTERSFSLFSLPSDARRPKTSVTDRLDDRETIEKELDQIAELQTENAELKDLLWKNSHRATTSITRLDPTN